MSNINNIEFEQVISLPLIKKIVTKKRLVDHQVSSYNYFVRVLLSKTIEKIINQSNNENSKKGLTITYESFYFKKPEEDSEAYLNNCIARNLTYQVNVWAKVEITSFSDENKTKKLNLFLFELPIMIGSILDESSPKEIGGYFVIKGGEKAIIANEETAPNKIYHKTGDTIEETETLYYSGSDSYKFLYKIFERKDDYILTFQPLKTEVEIFPLIKYLGVTSKEIFESLDQLNVKSKISMLAIVDKWLSVNLEDYLVEVWSKNQSREYGLKRLQEILDNYLLPTFGSDETSRLRKGEFLLKLLLSHLNTPKQKNLDYKDFLSLKRLKTVGELLEEKIGNLLEKAFLDFGEGITKKLKKKSQVFQALFKTSKITNGLISSISTGSWIGSRIGLNQVVERNNTITMLSGLRKVINSTSKLARGNIRDVNPSYWGRFCPVETSLSTTCGLLKFLAVGAKVSTTKNNEQLEEIINKEFKITTEKTYEVLVEDKLLTKTSTSLYVDGKKYLVEETLDNLLQKLKQLKRKTDYSVYSEENQIFVDSSLGRISRPLLVLPTSEKQRKNLVPYYTVYNDESLEGLVKKGVIEYLEYSEEKNSSIAISIDKIHTGDKYLEIHGVLAYGLSSNLVPYFNHNAASKTCFGGRMVKQAVSATNKSEILERYDTKRHELLSNQKPIVYSVIEETLETEPYGENLVVAIATLEGKNIDDSVILNKDSVEKGILNINCYRAQSKEKFFQDDFYEKVYVPPEKAGLSEYSILEVDGLPSANKMIQEDKVILSRNTFANSRIGALEDIDNSIEIMGKPNQYVSNVAINRAESGSLLYRVQTCYNVPLEVGEKVASRCGQKGIVSSLIPSTDLPFTQEGIKPDLLFTPHGIFGRMTFGHLLEMIAGKVGSMQGTRIPSTAFSVSIKSEEELREILVKAGLSDNGTEEFYDGKTGKKIQTRIYTGIIYYMRLFHLAMEKIYSRDYGPVYLLTLQPTEGKSRDGGLRFGEMERDSILGYGGSKIIRDRLEIDTVKVLLCKSCNLLVDQRGYINKCNQCNSKDVAFCNLPYSFYLLRNELFSMGMNINIELE